MVMAPSTEEDLVSLQAKLAVDAIAAFDANPLVLVLTESTEDQPLSLRWPICLTWQLVLLESGAVSV